MKRYNAEKCFDATTSGEKNEKNMIFLNGNFFTIKKSPQLLLIKSELWRLYCIFMQET